MLYEILTLINVVFSTALIISIATRKSGEIRSLNEMLWKKYIENAELRNDVTKRPIIWMINKYTDDDILILKESEPALDSVIKILTYNTVVKMDDLRRAAYEWQNISEASWQTNMAHETLFLFSKLKYEIEESKKEKNWQINENK